jgi:hypothetical protein
MKLDKVCGHREIAGRDSERRECVLQKERD